MKLPFIFFTLFYTSALLQGQNWLRAREAPPEQIDQLKQSGNACGPTCLLAAFGSGTERWEKVAKRVTSVNDRGRIQTVIRHWGMKKSRTLPNRLRYDFRKGVNYGDLHDMANEMREGTGLPEIEALSGFKKKKENSVELINRLHTAMSNSLKSGLPPIINLRRFAHYRLTSSLPKAWNPVQGHFVVMTGLDRDFNKGDFSFQFEYMDPWGGQIKYGTIQVPAASFYAAEPFGGKPGIVFKNPCLIALVPESRLGIHRLKKNEKTVVTLSGLLGHF